MPSRAETLKYVGRFIIVFSLAVFLLGRYYANLGLVSIATGFAILGVVCISDSIRHTVADVVVHFPRRSGAFRRRPSLDR
jgi:hypothetical protein